MYYVYLLIDPRNNQPFYAGKGKGKRASYHISQNKKGLWTENRFKDNVIRQILSEGKTPIIKYVSYFESEDDAYNFEASIIEKYGRRNFDDSGILTNICKDANPPQPSYSDDRRKKYSEMMRGNQLAKGRKQSESERAMRSEANQKAWDTGRRIVTDKMIEASSKTHRGKIVSAETRTKQSIAAKLQNKRGKTYEEIYGVETAAIMRRKRKERTPPNQKSIIIDGVEYESIKSAANKLQTTEYKVKKLANKQI